MRFFYKYIKKEREHHKVVLYLTGWRNGAFSPRVDLIVGVPKTKRFGVNLPQQGNNFFLNTSTVVIPRMQIRITNLLLKNTTV